MLGPRSVELVDPGVHVPERRLLVIRKLVVRYDDEVDVAVSIGIPDSKRPL